MKLAVIGGGGVRSPFLAKSLASQAERLGIHELVFMDNNQEKLALFGTLSRQIAARVNPDLVFSLTSDTVEAVTDADYVVTTIRSGGDESRVFDERTALELGILGQETTGAGGFAMALRSIPALLSLCSQVRLHAKPTALVFNFTNPSGLVTQALRQAGFDQVYGICDAPSGFEKQLIRALQTTEDHFRMLCFGLNHLSWYRDFRLDGRDVYHEILSIPDILDKTDLRYFDRDVVDLIGYHDLPNEYLYFYYYRNLAVDSIMHSQITRGETILEINRRMIAELKELDIVKDTERAFATFIRHYYERENLYFAIESGTTRQAAAHVPSLDEFVRAPDDGGYAGVAMKFIKGWQSSKPERIVLSVPNQGCLDFLEADDVVEISCEVSAGLVRPLPAGPVDSVQRWLIQTIKTFERETVRAIHERSRAAAIQALMIHPQVNSYNLAKKLVEQYLDQYHEYVGEW